MKLEVEIDGRFAELDLKPDSSGYHYCLTDETAQIGKASVVEVSPGVFSVLIGTQSFQVYLAKDGERLETHAGGERRWITVSDRRDRRAGARNNTANGPAEVRSQMPGKIIKILVSPGDAVAAGQGLLVVEAMKMQNEVKSPKDGVAAKIHVNEGATVGAGEKLLVIE